MHIAGRPIAECSTEELQRAFLALVGGLGDQGVAEAMTLMKELERRAKIVAVVNTLTEPKR